MNRDKGGKRVLDRSKPLTGQLRVLPGGVHTEELSFNFPSEHVHWTREASRTRTARPSGECRSRLSYLHIVNPDSIFSPMLMDAFFAAPCSFSSGRNLLLPMVPQGLCAFRECA